nr:hypothetical protein [Tanacetum cinerariifolium]
LLEALYERKCRSSVLWAEIGESSLIGPELVQEMTNKSLWFKVLLKVSPWKGVMRFGKKGKLAPSKIAIVKVRWGSKHGPEFTWECEDHMKASYACSDSLMLTPLCCDDINDVMPRSSALARCDNAST